MIPHPETVQTLIAKWRALGMNGERLIGDKTTLDMCADELEALLSSLPQRGWQPLDVVLAIVESEPELDGPMPEANRRLAEQVGYEEHARAVVRGTKASIIRRLKAAFVDTEPKR